MRTSLLPGAPSPLTPRSSTPVSMGRLCTARWNRCSLTTDSSPRTCASGSTSTSSCAAAASGRARLSSQSWHSAEQPRRRLWQPWLCINRVLRVMLHARWSAWAHRGSTQARMTERPRILQRLDGLSTVVRRIFELYANGTGMLTIAQSHDHGLSSSGAKRAQFGSMCGPHFCSMKITQDVRDYAAKHGISEETAAVVQGLREKAEESRKSGGEIYRPA